MTSIQSFYSIYFAVIFLLVTFVWVPISCETPVDDCTYQKNLCQNSATCQPNGVRFFCNCSAGWTGGFCNVSIPQSCASHPCSNGGNCTNMTYDSGMTTMTPTTMTTMTTTLTTMATTRPANASSNSTTSTNSTTTPQPTTTVTTTPAAQPIMTFQCACPNNFLGQDCAIKDYCFSSPCSNNATCINNFTTNTFNCLCPNGFNGGQCDVHCPPGKGGPSCSMWVGCKLNATVCQHGSCPACGAGCTTMNCSCNNDYTGDFCDIYALCKDNSSCHADAADPHGYCYTDVTAKTQTCQCWQPYYGTHCESVNCTQVTCKPNEECKTTSDTGMGQSYSCACKADFTPNGTAGCVPNPCASSPCSNGGTCVLAVDKSSYACNCTANYTGLNCREQACRADGDCSGHGTCTIDSRKCNCDAEYTGNLCEIARGTATTDPFKPEYVWAPILAAVVLVLVCLLVFLIMTAKTKRAQQGTYSPSRQEQQGSRVEIGLVLKPPPEERLI